jgi:hypothetical protein
MACRKRSNLVKKEKFCIGIRGHQLPFPTLELQQANDPGLGFEQALELFVPAMKNAPISHERASGTVSLNPALGQDAIL